MNKNMSIFGCILMLVLMSGCGTKTEQITVQGTPGQNGYSIVAKTVSDPEICGDAGGTTVYLALDLDRNLQFSEQDEVQTQYITCNGTNGRDGLNGTSCTINKEGNAATITCGNSSAVVVDGSKGDKGDKGDTGAAGQNASGIYITSIINPCGEEFANDEVLLKLSNGRILALYDGGPNEDRLALIAPGNYITTDASQSKSCSFTITSDYKITNEVRR